MKISQEVIEKENESVVEKKESGTETHLAKLIDTRWVSESTYVLRLERKGFDFVPGQYITLGIPKNKQTREYSIYSGDNEPFIEVLIREVEDGFLSLKLKKIKVGDNLLIDGPFGFFNMNESELTSHKHLFIATGTGISPFHSFVKSYPHLNYKLIHGVRFADEAYERAHYNSENYVLCTSKDDKGDYAGRVTDYLKENEVDNDTLVYLCGNSEMVYDVYDILMSRGLPSENIRTEVYF